MRGQARTSSSEGDDDDQPSLGEKESKMGG